MVAWKLELVHMMIQRNSASFISITEHELKHHVDDMHKSYKDLPIESRTNEY